MCDSLIVRIDASRDRLIVTKNGVAKIISIQQEDGNGLDEIKEDNTAAGKNYQDLKEGRNSIYKQDSSMTFGLTRAVSNLLSYL